VVFTLGAAGAVLFEAGGNSYRTYGQPARRPRVRAGDDAFLAAFALGLAAGADPVAAAELGTAATLVVVKQDGTVACRAQELREQLAGAAKVTSLSRLIERVETYREQGRSVVFTNGCFDILHLGHIAYLNRAKALGDVLVVGVNSDESVQRLKGASRPINPLQDRLAVLAALSSIDHLVEFDADTPAHLIRAIRPDVFVKGGDYTRETLPEAPLVEELGAALCILPFVEDRSTTGIIARIRSGEATRTGT
jgi:D-beta-D-heptose 7-phosphate kinase/D-beta-D-heptose 1-phosphate adenosyltransferase